MYSFLALLCGVLIAIMISLNGGLTALYGTYWATVLIHMAGLAVISIAMLLRGERPFRKRQPWYLYLGGAIGVATTVFNNAAFSALGISAILALSLLGQCATGLLVDQFGLLGMEKHAFQKSRLMGVLLTAAGVAVMLDRFVFLPVLLSFLAGVSLVLSRALNAGMTENTSVGVSTFFNYFVGLAVSIPVCMLLGRGEPAAAGFVFTPKVYLYLGGVVGVMVIALTNITVRNLSAFLFSLFLFVGQVFTGILIDGLLSGTFSPRTLLGGVLVAAGVIWNQVLEKKRQPSEAE